MTITQPQAAKNNPNQAGYPASKQVLFGDRSRYATYAVHTRFDTVQWFVYDAEMQDKNGHPTIIRQDDDFSKAIAGL